MQHRKITGSLEFPALLQKVAALVEEQIRRVEDDMGKGLQSSAVKAPDPLHTKMLVELVGAAKSLGGEIRLWDGHQATNLDKMSPARKANVCIQFLLSLPLSGRRDVYSVLAKSEQDRPDGLGLAITDRFAGAPGE